MYKSLIIIMLLCCAASVTATTITVRKDGTGDFTVLQQALSAAADGDSVLIGPGEFTEMPWVRIPGWSWDVRSCGYIEADNLTIIGSGQDQTLIGPTVYSANNSIASPKAIFYGGGGLLRLQGLTLRNCYEGILMRGTLYIDECAVENNYHGAFWEAVNSGGMIRNTVFGASSPSFPTAVTIFSNGSGSGILMEHCHVDQSETIIDRIQGMTIIDCQFTNYIIGLSIYGNARVNLVQSEIANMSSYGIRFALGAGGYCEVRDSDIAGGISALDTGGNATGGRFVVYGSRLTGGSAAVLHARNRPGACIIRNCDLIKGSGPVVQCGPSYVTVTHDLANNYWGTVSEADIQSWIVDHNDDSNIPATVLYQPFVGQPVPSETTTWGDVKALFR